MRGTPVFILVLLLLSMNMLTLAFNIHIAKSTENGWWDSAWIYRMQLNIIRLLPNIQPTQATSFEQKSQQSQVVIHEGDILVNGSQKLTIKNCKFVQYGKITVENNATLDIENATLYIKNPSDPFRYGLTVTDQSSLLLTNATLILAHGREPYIYEQTILIEKNATAVVLDSNITSPFRNAWMVARYNSKISVQNSSFDNSTGLGSFDNSTGYIQDSTLTYQLNAARNSELVVEDSDINNIHGTDVCEIQIKNCVIYSYSEIYWGTNLLVYNSSIFSIFTVYDATARFEGSSIDKLIVNDCGSARLICCSTSKTRVMNNSTVWLINSDGGVISTLDESEVFVGYDLPLFGVVTFPYTWVPVLQAFLIILVTIIVIVVLLLIRRRFRQ